MTEPCKQDETVKVLQIEQAVITKSLTGIEDTLKSNNRLLAQVSSVLSDLKHLHEDSRRNEKAIHEVFNRVRALEVKPTLDKAVESLAITVGKLAKKVDGLEKTPGQFASKAWWVVFGVLAGSAGSVVSGVIILMIRWGVDL